ncbi:MAG: ribosome small subunit-dependent GTPase A [Pseudomonadota bacterium]|nr:ribosome small subunit-dependent GTPase A [Pseudomonadota bacterium]MED5443434.1 ribosome small subunit-dependent GTPase A [Pseudomonadota bacterium]MEE3109415.1 ribosome small subunit-dependent GTPase A [Pseudomonadota bacterium]
MTRAIVLSHLGHELLVAPEPSLAPTRCALRSALPPLVAGDEVRLAEDGDTVLAVEALPRQTLLERQTARGTRPICANLDTLLITFASAPAPHGDLLDPLLAAAFDAGLEPWLLHNKCDLASPEAEGLHQELEALGFRVFRLSAQAGEGIEALHAALQGRRAAFAGQSGVGKSSLLNALVPEAAAKVGSLSERLNRGLGRGRHTTSVVRLYPLGATLTDGTLIDAPGLRRFVPLPVSAWALARTFPDVAAAAEHCRFRDCAHDQEPGCGVQAALADGTLSAERATRYRQCQAGPEAP